MICPDTGVIVTTRDRIENDWENMWKLPRTVDEMPEVPLTQWQVFEVPCGDRHVIGWSADQFEGRVSERIVMADLATRRFTAASGRTYVLVGQPGCNLHAQCVWCEWTRFFKISAFNEISDSMYDAMTNPSPVAPPCAQFNQGGTQ